MPDENVYTEAHGFKFPNGTTIPIEDAEARESISEIKQSLSHLDGLIIYVDLTPTDDYAEFNNGSNLPLISLVSTIEYSQSGSGIPSPTNPRPITGHSAINIVVSPNGDFSGGTTYTVNFVDGGNPLIAYKGYIDLDSGKLVITHICEHCDGTESWTATAFGTTSQRFTHTPAIGSSTTLEQISDRFVFTSSPVSSQEWGVMRIGANIVLYDGGDNRQFSTATDFTDWLENNPTDFVYEIANPIIYQLTPIQILTLIGQNYIKTNTGVISNVKYLGVLNLS